MIPVEEGVMQPLKDFAKSIPVPFEHDVEIRFFNAEPNKTLYTVMKSPPNNAAFMAETDIVSISKVGFIGELLILFAQSKGLSTCWYGHYKLSELERLMPHLQSAEQLKESNMGYGYSKGVTIGRRVICITPLGYYEDGGLRLMDRITKKPQALNDRKLKIY
jgi:nitroreductase